MSGLIRKSRSAVVWNFGFSLFKDSLQFGLALVLVRILTPEAYGQYGLITSILGLFTVISFRSFVAHTLQIRRDEDVDYQIHFTAGVFIQSSLFIIANLAALILYQVKQYAQIAPLLSVMSLLLLIDLSVELRVKMLERRLEWKRFRLLNGIGVLIYAILAITLAISGAGVYSLLIPNLLVPLPFIYDLYVKEKWRPRWYWNADRFSLAWRFGLTRILSGLLSSGRLLLESGALVLLVGYANFGFYGRANGLAQLVCIKFAFLLMQAIYPMLTKIEGGTTTSTRASGLILRSIGWSVIPMATILAVVADPLIRTIYGEKWLEVIPLVLWAMVVGAAGAMGHAAYMLLLAGQHERLCLYSDVWVLIGTCMSLLWLAPHGLLSYMIGVATIQIIFLLVNVTGLYRVKVVSIKGIVSAVMWPIVAALIALAICNILWPSDAPRTILMASIYSLVFGFLYVGTLRMLFSVSLGELIHCLPGGKRLNRWLLIEV